MSKKNVEKEEDTRSWLIRLLYDNPDSRLFPLAFYGNISAYNPKTKKPCTGSIIFPNDLGDTTNLKFLDNWKFLVIAIPDNKEENKSKNEINQIRIKEIFP